MKRAISVAALKRHRVPHPPAAPRFAGDVARRPDGFLLTRRQAIGLATGLSVAAAPIASAVDAALSSSYRIVRRGSRVAFVVAGVERWVLDPRQFDGNPTLVVEEHDDGVHVSLTHAFFPGTTVPADLTAEIDRGIKPRISLRLTKLNTRAQAPFIPWLLERARLEDTARIASAYMVGDTHAELHGSFDVTYRPSWTIDLEGSTQLSVQHERRHTYSGSMLTVHLCTPTDGSLLVPKATHHTVAELRRGSHPWDVSLRVADTDSWKAYAADDAFDLLTVEASGDARTSVMFHGRSDGRVWLQPNEIDTRIGLREVRYAWSTTDAGRHEALVARYAKVPQWMILSGISLEIGDRDGIPPLEVERRNGQLTRCVVAPALLRYTIPVDNAITEPTRLHPRSQIALVPPNVAAQALPGRHVHLASLQMDQLKGLKVTSQGRADNTGGKSRITVKQGPKTLSRSKFGLTLAQNPSVTVIRPDDLLVLTFEFSGITINKGAGRFTAGGNGKLIVHFQPQHIAERAFFYSTEEPNTAGLPNSAKESSGDNEPLLEPPIDAVMAHPSRLVFNVPSGHAGSYSIEGLLDWSKFTQRVSPSAKPPDVPYVLSRMSSAFVGKYLASGSSTVNPSSAMVIATKTNKAGNATVASKAFTVDQGIVAKVPPAKRSMATSQISANGDFANAMSKKMVDDYLSLLNATPPIRTPLDDETVIEYPYRLMLSPNKFAAWAHALTPKRDASNGRTELWHTRLGVKHSDGSVSEEAAYFRTVRAIWSPDVGTAYAMPAKEKERPFRTSINRRDRHELVQLTSNYGMQTEDQPVDVKRLMLTSLGAWADMTGVWDPYTGEELDVEQWIQRGTQGRDHFVRICYKGFLFPFGHRATLVKETERKFRRTPRGDMAAYLMQRLYIILREPVKDYPADGLAGMQYQGRDSPFRRITITTKVTPNLRLPVALGYGMGSNSFWPMFDADGGPANVQWSCIGRDWDNNDVQFSAPLTFIANGDAAANHLETWINTGYRKNNSVKPFRTLSMGGQHIAFAPSVKRGDTAMPTQDFLLTGYYSNSVAPNTPRFFPSMQKASVSIEKVNELLGTDSPREIQFFLPYLRHAFEKGAALAKGAQATKDNLDSLKNTAQIYLALLEPLGMNFNSQSDKSGGLAAPSIDIGALSRVMGPIPGDFKIADTIENELDKIQAMASKVENAVIAAGNFDPMQYFSDLLNTKILGDITLQDVLDFLQDVLSNADKMPGLDKKDDYGISDQIAEAASKSDIANELVDKINKNEAVRAASKQLDAEINQVASEVKAAKQRLEAEIDKVTDEINAIKQDILNEVKGARQELDNKLREWKKRVDDKVNELKSEVEKAIQPLKEAGNEAYKRYTQVTDALESLKQGLNLSYEWQTEIKKTPGDLLVPLYPGTTKDREKAILYLKAEITKKLNLDPPEVHLYGSISNFVVNLIGTGAAQFLIIKFNRISLSAKVGEKPTIDPDIEEVAFAGPLSFVNKLKDLIPSGGGGGGGGVGFSFGFDVQPKGITATLTITLPNVTVGVFSLMNMSFLMSLTVPFDGRAFSAYFAFCTRDNPFRLTVMVFAGGGFFGIEITPKGVRMLEAAFEFGGNFAFDCGVASGGASVMAGVYYKLEQKEIDGKLVDQSELTGYFRLTGNLSILGLIRVSLLFELKLTWQDNGKVFGTATIEIEIEILFVSFSVGVTVERQLKGSDSDPTFTDMLPQPQMWQEYCNAFA